MVLSTFFKISNEIELSELSLGPPVSSSLNMCLQHKTVNYDNQQSKTVKDKQKSVKNYEVSKE